MKKLCVSFPFFNPLHPRFLSPENLLLDAPIFPFILKRVGLSFLFLNKTICDDDPINLLEFLLNFSFGFKNTTKLFFVPIFKPRFDVFTSLFKHEHFSALNGHIFHPPFFNIAGEVRVREPDIFKPKRSVLQCTHKSGFKLDRLVV